MKMLLAACLVVFSCAIHAQDMFMVRSQQSFPETMAVLQETIKSKGYTLSRVQRVDIGLTASGYMTDKYRVVFFGKADEVRKVAAKHDVLVAYLPLKIAIFAEGDDTILLASSFRNLKPYFTDPEVLDSLERWESDIAAILETVRVAR